MPARDLRNNLSGVLRRVEAGEHLRVTVTGRPVAEPVPLPGRPTEMSWDVFMRDSEEWRADCGLTEELAALMPG
ncbi:MAG: prevent-host-death family protein [Chloroflexi bacterium]|nr:MAG: prevent-host-death family protein [Chloroflexota bacterium]